MLRISNGTTDETTVTLRLEGQIAGLWVDELKKTSENYMGNGHSLVLDVTEVTFVDRDGVMLLLNLQERTVAMKGCSPFLREQLKRTDAK